MREKFDSLKTRRCFVDKEKEKILVIHHVESIRVLILESLKEGNPDLDVVCVRNIWEAIDLKLNSFLAVIFGSCLCYGCIDDDIALCDDIKKSFRADLIIFATHDDPKMAQRLIDRGCKIMTFEDLEKDFPRQNP